MAVAVKPLAEITQEALSVLYKNLGIVNTTRFINQFTIGYGNYTEEREELFGDKTLEELVSEIKQKREK
ncbi:MAG: hypothetical protein JXA42_16005 [Anaerolineales bacterium]|nr:hypothetical protein [Anaerolineales bacterium]